MPGVTREQIAAAKQMTAIEFLRRYRPEELQRASSPGEFQLKSHDSFKIRAADSVWHWKSRDIGGKSALDYLVYVEGVRFVDAVERLCSDTPCSASPLPAPIREPKPFALPAAAPDDARVFAYLQGRGVSREVIAACVRQGILYESEPYHNAVFVGRDEAGKARYAFLRGTYPKGRPFRMEQAGSDKRYGFCVASAVPSQRVAVYEAAIDLLAHWTLEGTNDKHRLSLGGIYAPKEGAASRDGKLPPALDSFLARHPEICEIEVCTDNDHAGRWAAEHIQKAYQGRHQVCIHLPPIEGRDWADMAQKQMQKHWNERAVRQQAVSALKPKTKGDSAR